MIRNRSLCRGAPQSNLSTLANPLLTGCTPLVDLGLRLHSSAFRAIGTWKTPRRFSTIHTCPTRTGTWMFKTLHECGKRDSCGYGRIPLPKMHQAILCFPSSYIQIRVGCRTLSEWWRDSCDGSRALMRASSSGGTKILQGVGRRHRVETSTDRLFDA